MSDADSQTVVEASGAALAAARQAQGLSVADAARQLKLSVSQIEALESGNFEKLPGPVFVRGFIRNYARMLKLDAEELLRSVDLALPATPANEEVPPSQDIPFPTAKPRRSPWYALSLVLLLGGLTAFDYFWNEPEPAITKPIVTTATPVHKDEHVVATQSRDTGPDAAAAQAPAVAAVAPAAPVPAAPASVEGNSVASGPGTVAAVAVQQPQSGERTLRLVFNQESWVEIRDRSGKIVLSQLNPAGSEKRVNGVPPLTLVIGNAQGVVLTYNGQPVDLALHTNVDVARFTLE